MKCHGAAELHWLSAPSPLTMHPHLRNCCTLLRKNCQSRSIWSLGNPRKAGCFSEILAKHSVWSRRHQPIGVRAILYSSNLKHLEEVFALPRQPDCMGLKQYAKTAKLGFCSCQTRVWQLPNWVLAWKRFCPSGRLFNTVNTFRISINQFIEKTLPRYVA